MRRPVCLTTTIFGLAVVLTLSACGDDDKPDGGVDGGPDAGSTDLGPSTLPDAAPPADALPRPDATPSTRDAGHYCVMGGQVPVDNNNVPLAGTPSSSPTTSQGDPSVLTCINERPPQPLAAPMRIVGCLDFIGAVPTVAELNNELDIDVFVAHPVGETELTDPSWDRGSGVDRDQDHRLSPGFVVENQPTCQTGRQLVLGLNAPAGSTLATDVEYVVRVRSSTTVMMPTWAPTYYFGVIIYSEDLSEGNVQSCTPQTCVGRVSFTLIRQSGLRDLITQSAANIAGAADLNDGVGAGYGFVLANDCGNGAMTRAIAGFDPTPAAKGYLTSTGMFSATAAETAANGLALGLGFSNTSTTAPGTVRAAVGVTRGACTESFAGGSYYVFPDSVSVLLTGPRFTLHQRP